MIKTISNNFHLFSKESGQRHIHSSTALSIEAGVDGAMTR